MALSSEAEFAERMVEKYRGLLLECAGHVSIMVDGLAVTYRDLSRDYDLWRKRLDRANGKRPGVAKIILSNE